MYHISFEYKKYVHAVCENTGMKFWLRSAIQCKWCVSAIECSTHAYCLTTFLYNILKHTTWREEQNSIYGTNLQLWALIQFPQYSYWMLIVLCYEMALSGHTLGFIIITSRHIKRIHRLAIFNWNVGLWQVHLLARTLEKPSGVSNFIQFGFNFQLFSHFYYLTVFFIDQLICTLHTLN